MGGAVNGLGGDDGGGARAAAPTGMTLRQLELFCAVADHGSFAAAGQALYLTPNAVALAVTELESHLGARLCVRRRARGVTLTPSGLRLVERARALLRDAAELQRELSGEPGELQGPVTVGCYSTLAPILVPPLLDEFAAQNPRLELTCVDGPVPELLPRLTSGELDMLVAFETSLPADLERRRLYDSTPVVLLPEGHPLAAGETVELSALAEHGLVLLDLPPYGENTLNVLRGAGLRPRVVHRTGNFELVRSLVARGVGYSLVYSRPAMAQSYEGRGMVALPVRPAVEPTRVVVCWSPAMPLTDRARAVTEFLADAAPNTPAP